MTTSTEFEQSLSFRSPGLSRAKRAFDIVTVSFLSPLWLALLAVVGLAVKVDSAGPVFFRHRRIGYGGKEFLMWKFRTMKEQSEGSLADHLAADKAALQEWSATQKLKSDPRITRAGFWLRRFSLDELPQFLNVLSGDMSLVGPRPIYHPREVQRWGESFFYYTSTRPGLTGPWQISGRNDLSYEERIRLDMQYVTEWSFANDLKTLLATPRAVFSGRGAY